MLGPQIYRQMHTYMKLYVKNPAYKRPPNLSWLEDNITNTKNIGQV